MRLVRAFITRSTAGAATLGSGRSTHICSVMTGPMLTPNVAI